VNGINTYDKSACYPKPRIFTSRFLTLTFGVQFRFIV